MKRGTQIVYMPSHANGDMNHHDCEAGFITSVQPSFAFCRYWRKDEPGVLRTLANSERTPICALVEYDTVMQVVVDDALEEFC